MTRDLSVAVRSKTPKRNFPQNHPFLSNAGSDLKFVSRVLGCRVIVRVRIRVW